MFPEAGSVSVTVSAAWRLSVLRGVQIGRSLSPPITAAAIPEAVVAGDAKRGGDIFWKHPAAACVNCHALGGKESAVGPALDGIAKARDEAYLIESLADPNARLAESYKATPISPCGGARLRPSRYCYAGYSPAGKIVANMIVVRHEGSKSRSRNRG